MKRRITELIAAAQSPPVLVDMRADLSERIFQDIQARKLYTYQEAADLIGCNAETIRIHAKGLPIIKRSKPHRIPACVLEIIVKTKLVAAA